MLRFICTFFINSHHFRFLLAKFKPSLLLMESRYRGQDVVRCTLCTTAVAPMHCEVCQIDLCKDCVEKHLSDQSKSQVHKVVSLKQYHFSWQYPKCLDHPGKQCELHCKECDDPICSQCVISEKHKHHKIVDIEEIYKNNQEFTRIVEFHLPSISRVYSSHQRPTKS